MNKLEEFLGQVKIEEILYTKFAGEQVDRGFSKAETDMNEDNVKARLRQYMEAKLSSYRPAYFIHPAC